MIAHDTSAGLRRRAEHEAAGKDVLRPPAPAQEWRGGFSLRLRTGALSGLNEQVQDIA